MITIELPWPDSDLSPNARVHWAVKAKAASRAREDGYWCVSKDTEIVCDYLEGEVFQVTYIFHPPDKRKRDDDNIIGALKSYRDGVCDYFGIDDSCLRMAAPEWGEVVKGGKMVLTLEAIE